MSSERHPSLVAAPGTPGFLRMFAPQKLTLGLFFPIEAYPDTDIPTLDNQFSIAKAADEGGFAAFWTRDVPLRDPRFGDVGQMLDPWVWMAAMTSVIKNAAFSTGSLILPLRHPIHTAKAAASLDYLTGGRFVPAFATGDRPVEYPAFGQDLNTRGDSFRDAFGYVEALLSQSFPLVNSPWGHLSGADLVPKPSHGRLPIGVTGRSRQTLEWTAEHADFWLTYPVSPATQAATVPEWRAVLDQVGSDIQKPIAQSLYIDLAPDPDAPLSQIWNGVRLGRKALIDMLHSYQRVGVNHVGFVLKLSQRPAAEIVDEMIRDVLPHFPAHNIPHSTEAQDAARS